MAPTSSVEIPSDKIAGICKRYGIQEMAIFGSAARGDLRPDSDVDVIVEFFPDSHCGFVARQKLEEELAALFGRRVDLGTKEARTIYVA